jgi:hypothetical protein
MVTETATVLAGAMRRQLTLVACRPQVQTTADARDLRLLLVDRVHAKITTTDADVALRTDIEGIPMLTPEIVASREKTLTAHLLGESVKDVDAVLATFTGVPTYELVSVDKTVRGEENVRMFLQTFFDSMGPNDHIGEAFYHGDDATAVEVLTVFPHGFDGQQTDQVIKVRSMGVFLFDGEAMHTEKLYADVAPLVPFMPWLVES